MIATQHSGGGKANQYFLRGINLDHGTDFSVHFDGMPVNFRSHAHGQGYLDLNFIIPELVQTIEYHRGTYDADAGDFSAASAAYFQTYDRLDRGFAELTWGSENYLRAVGANSWDVANGTWLAGAELQFSDGPWDNPEAVRRYNGLLKYSTELAGLPAEFMATYYSNDWNATDQIPQRSVDSGDIGRFGFIDPSVGGKTRRFNLIGNLETDATHYSVLFYPLRSQPVWQSHLFPERSGQWRSDRTGGPALGIRQVHRSRPGHPLAQPPCCADGRAGHAL